LLTALGTLPTSLEREKFIRFIAKAFSESLKNTLILNSDLHMGRKQIMWSMDTIVYIRERSSWWFTVPVFLQWIIYSFIYLEASIGNLCALEHE
jgi:hypothetical protein